MNPELWRQVERVFADAVERAPAERAAFLDRVCEGNTELRREVESLLACDAPDQLLVDVPPYTGETDLAGHRCGPYVLIRSIGHGGMGAVYLGVRDDDQYKKQVAVKVLRRGMDTEFMLSRFRQERQILANLEHPFIARLIDGGATDDGLPYFVMEFVDGVPITRYCADNNLTVPEILRLFRLACEAVQYAHQNLVVHRDIKPSNILTTKEGIPKLLDFGIAKAIAPGNLETDLTRAEVRMLTPDYASPEQVTRLPLSTATDTYSLGVVLYELLARRRAHRFPSGSISDIEKTICESETEKPSVAVARDKHLPSATRRQLQRQLAGDLDNIVLAAMRKEPQRRYPSVADLSEDIRRHLEGLPVLVREDRWTYRASKFVARNRIALVAATLVVVSLIGGMVATTAQARRAERRFQEVRGLANSFLFDVHDQIEALPGSTRARESIVRTVLKYLNNLADEAGGDPSLLYELAVAYQRIGDVQGYGVRPNLGHRDEATKSYRKALEIAEGLAAHRYDLKVQRLLAVAHHRVGYLIEGDQANPTGGLEHYGKALQLLERLNHERPGNPEDSPLLITIHGHMGDAYLLRGRARAAAECWDRELEVAGLWFRNNPSDESRNALGVAHRRVSHGKQLNGAVDKAIEHAQKAIDIHEPLAASHPSSIALQRELLNSYERLAFVAADPDALNAGDMQLAHTSNAKVVAIAKALSEGDRNNRMALSDYVISLRSACLFEPDNDPARVVTDCQFAVDQDSGGTFVYVDISVAHRLGPALAGVGRLQDAESTMHAALARLSQLCGQWPWRADLRRQLARVHKSFGDLLLNAKRSPEAMVQYNAAMGIDTRLLHDNPRDLVARRDLADLYVTLGRFYEQSDRNKAADYYRKDLGVWTEWNTVAESSSFDRRRRASALRNIARCEVSNGIGTAASEKTVYQ